mmetsp:Transcript_5886/g.9566  ORF Transcript_5886/g.9566 Transcript_5886/m.9566 type:complete len:798 (-) Transcript_5886:323-2716(-)
MKGAKTPMREIRLRLFGCAVVCLLCFDVINPVKICSEVLNIHPAWFFLVSLAFSASIIYGNFNDLIYFSTKVFFKSILSIFFSSIEVVGKENIPTHGPVIFTGNHMNQFVDAAVVLTTTPHKVGFLVAEKSYKKKGIGHIAKAMESIPVARPQDTAVKGPGLVKLDGKLLVGKDTQFTKLNKRDKILDKKSVDGYMIKSVVSDTELIILNAKDHDDDEGEGEWLEYDILPYVDQSGMFDFVHAALAKGNCLGIFPEGGSHDNTHLLPLKAGIAAIAFGTMDKYSINVPIVPVGLNYYRGHRFRGRVVVEFGAPKAIDKDMYSTFKNNKREGYTQLLNQIEESMRSVLVTAPDYKELQLLAAARRLYQDPTKVTSIKCKQDLARRFSMGFAILRKKYMANGKGYKEMPQDIQDVAEKLDEYLAVLHKWGLRDYQVSTLDEPNPAHHYHTFAHALVVMLLASIPTLFLNLPVGVLVGIVARREAKEDLKKSRVKLHARDVLLSKKILYSIVAVPALWLLWGVVLFIIVGFSFKATLMFLFCCPFFSYIGVMAVEAGMMDIKDFRPVYNRLFSQFREEVVKELPKQRVELQAQVRALVRKYGPDLDALYFPEDVQWEQIIRHHLRDDYATSKEKTIEASKSDKASADDDSSNTGEDSKSTMNDGDKSSGREGKEEEEDDDYERRVSNIPGPEEAGRRTTSTEDESPFSLLPEFSISLGLQNTESSNDFIQEYVQNSLKKSDTHKKTVQDLAGLSLSLQEDSSSQLVEEEEEVERGNEDEEELEVAADESDTELNESKKDK